MQKLQTVRICDVIFQIQKPGLNQILSQIIGSPTIVSWATY